MNNITKKIEAILFWRAEPISKKKLAEFLQIPVAEIEKEIATLESELHTRGIVLIRKEDEVMLGTAPEHSTLIERLTKEELHKELGKAGLETLSIVLYFGPVTRSEIDYIRGVNSTFVLRNLMVRGLVERSTNTEDQRSFLYKPTFQMLSFLGLTSVRDMPDYDSAQAELKNFKESQAQEDTSSKEESV
ncbi:MAG: hypothetical protein A3C06_04760 [Candidatus Taylorbacteria bacterium RIFCSPHIGHO2_02_FULL_46_13]|uniref:SMC-Scp complex subunit ScpB n=1 Tax=Candidatus Taylorbacteria bacterium RIFCSPHIGHO2_02_FULL_46_13 TaxID=1802312 RepID=A0A1G2MTG6_9BACT|nr:MAG: hypothetical protein A3C06_04760 [Candidatus Taylorbacteria bacterium RIFCSPHIGHO2_02_FULL_46_13]